MQLRKERTKGRLRPPRGRIKKGSLTIAYQGYQAAHGTSRASCHKVYVKLHYYICKTERFYQKWAPEEVFVKYAKKTKRSDF